MWVRRLRLTDFRSYESVDIPFDEGVVTLVGANGQGKTNVVEAIGYLATLGSHRVSSDAPLVRMGATSAVVSAEVVKDERSVIVELEINPGKANRARINRSPATRARDILGIVSCVVFTPEDLALVKGDPSERRRFLDEVLVQRTPRLQAVRSDYERILKQRNALLKSSRAARRQSADAMLATLSVWDEQLAAVGGELAAARVQLVLDLLPHVASHYLAIAGGEQAVSSGSAALTYRSTHAPALSTTTDKSTWAEAISAAIVERRADELDRGVTLVGPHRDDLEISIGEFPAKGYASHGECWSLALSLRLASMDLLRADGDDPILILDDVFAELDATRRSCLIEAMAGVTQVIVTAAVEQDVPAALTGPLLRVTKGRVDV